MSAAASYPNSPFLNNAQAAELAAKSQKGDKGTEDVDDESDFFEGVLFESHTEPHGH